MPKKKTPKFGSKASAATKDAAMDEAKIWMRDLVKWCEDLRIDVIRLEGAVGFSRGDPGPPPEEPWE